MNNRRLTKITMETHEVTIVRIKQSQLTRQFCRVCRTDEWHLPVARAAAVLRISETAVFRLIENKRFHSTETDAGELLVCRNSLEK